MEAMGIYVGTHLDGFAIVTKVGENVYIGTDIPRIELASLLENARDITVQSIPERN